VRSIQVAGEGNLSMAFQLMKEKLEKEGLFDPAHKRPIPAFPHKIGILTSSTGAAVKDIVKIIRSKNELVDILIFPVQVQGEGAAQNIAETLKLASLETDSSSVIDLNGKTLTVKSARVNGVKLSPGTYAADNAAVSGFVVDPATGGSLVVTGGGFQLVVR